MEKIKKEVAEAKIHHLAASSLRACTNLCRGHNSVTSPTEFWELLGVITKTYWSGIWRGAILHLKLQLVQRRKIVARHWSNKEHDRYSGK